MVRRRKGPIQLNEGATWYVRLWVGSREKPQGSWQSTLIWSQKTNQHAEAWVRCGATYRQLEEEPEALGNSAPSLREQVEQELEEPNGPPTDRPLPPIEPTEIQVGVFSPTTTLCCH